MVSGFKSNSNRWDSNTLDPKFIESFELIRYRGVSLVSNDFYICSVDNIWWVPAVINTKWFQLKPNFAFYSEVEPSLIILNWFLFQKVGT